MTLSLGFLLNGNIHLNFTSHHHLKASLYSSVLFRCPVPAGRGRLGEVQRGHEWLLHGSLCRRGVELYYQAVTTQSHSPER